ncbi:MAG: carboxypeptidase regulatory-like domain-containing protein [Bryobacteraceae bacterium]
MRNLASSHRRGAIRCHARALILLLAATAAPFAQTAPAADQNSASVEGVVVNALTGDPLPRVHVTLFHYTSGARQRYGAMTTAEGKFSITGLPEGSYIISANRLGFISAPRRSDGFALKPGERKDDLTLKLTPTGAISGTVVDADGEPVENCSVVAESGRGGQGSTADAQGRFRIGGLTPGKYRIKATPDEPQTPPEIRTDGTAEAHYSETYYPSALDAASATTIDVAPGAEADSTEIRLVRIPIVRVSGKVTGIPQGAENVILTLGRPPAKNQGLGWSFTRNGGWSSSAAVKKDGTFAVWRLAPGPFRISAQWNSPTGQSVAAPPVEVVVGDSNIDGIELRMIPAADITGQVQYEDDAARPPAPAAETPPARRNVPQVFLQGIDGSGGSAFARVDENGVFTIPRVMPGRYHVRWNGGRGYVKSMLLGSTEIAGDILDLSGGAAGAALTILISTQFGSVSGTVQSDGASAAGLQVVLLPDSEESGGPMGFQVHPLGADGSYSFGFVIPGTYKLAAMAPDDFNAVTQGEQDWEAYAPVIETVTIAAGDKATQDLKVLKPQ